MSRNVALNKDEGFIWWLKTSWDWALMRCFYGDRNSRPYIMELGGPFWKVKGQSQKSHTRPCDVHDELKKHLDDWNIWRVPNVWEQTVFVRGPNAKVNCCSPWSSTFSSAKAPVVVDFNPLATWWGNKIISGRMRKHRYLHTLLHLNPSILVIIHHLMDALQSLQAVTIGFTYTRWRHHHAWVYTGPKDK